MDNAKMGERWDDSIMATYGTPDIALTHGRGAHVWDADGNEYVDMTSGLSVNALGHAHPAVVAAVTEQVSKLAHTSNIFINEPSVKLAERLLALFGIYGTSGKVFFCNSGTEVNEAAFKIARRTGRPNIVSALGSFHGRTMGALSLTGQPAKQNGFSPLLGNVSHVPFGDVSALQAAVDHDTAAVFLEPIQAEGGVIPAPDGYLRAARGITSNAGALLILDEVQTGIGRTGSWFGHDNEGIRPDVVTLAKGLGGGLPIGACIGFDEASQLLRPGQHASTFGGNAVSCAAGLAVLDTIEHDNLLAHVERVGSLIISEINALNHPLVKGVRGRGLLLGLVLRQPKAQGVKAQAQQSGFLLNVLSPSVVRIAPPLVISEADVRSFIDGLANWLNRVDG